jgi:hypothetical protein
MGICKNKSTWSNLLAMFKMTPTLYDALINFSMVLSKLLGLGMIKWIDFYTKKVGSHLIVLFLHVYDLILTSSNPKLLTSVISILKKKFKMIYLGYLHYFSSLQVLQTKEGIYLSQYQYACDLLCHFHMEYFKPTPSPF